MIIGRRRIRVKKYDDYQIKCENCGSYEHRFTVYQEHFHVMFIPAFPSGLKSIKCVCNNCKDTFNQEKKKYYLEKTRTPIYFYTWIIFFVGFFLTAVVLGQITSHHTKEYLDNPKIGDVYCISKTENNTPRTYFLKIRDIRSDTLEMMHSALIYPSSASSMNDSDYFIKNDLLKISRNDLQKYHDKGTITVINRDYNNSSNFSKEK